LKLQAFTYNYATAVCIIYNGINPVSLRAGGQLSPYREEHVRYTIFFLLDEVEYTFDIYGAQIFPNDELKSSILTERNHSVYNISRLSFR
jgi:hypothetical protein